jgi:hypothetical protein
MPLEQQKNLSLDQLPVNELREITNKVEGKKFNQDIYDKSLEKLSNKALRELVDIDNQRQLERDEQNVRDLLESQTITGQAKKFGKAALETAVEAGEFIDKFTGAPTRAAIGKLQEGEPLEAISAFGKQFGEDPKLAPTGKQIAAKAGLSEEAFIDLPVIGGVSPAGFFGLGIDIMADPTSIIPAGAIGKVFKVAGKGLGKTVQVGVKGTAKAADVLTDSTIPSKLVELADGTARNAVEVLKNKFTPTIADDFSDLSAIAKKNNIKLSGLALDSAKHGKEGFITRAARTMAEGPLGEPIQKEFKEVIEDVNSKVGDLVEKFSDGRVLSNEEAGKLLREEIEKSSDKLFNSIDFTYDEIRRQNPGLNFQVAAPESWDRFQRRMRGIRKELIGRVKRGFRGTTQAQAEETIRGIDNLVDVGGNWKQTVEQLREIGREAFPKNLKFGDPVPPDIDTLRDIYFATQEALIDATRKIMGDEIADDLILNNQLISQYIRDKGIVGKILNREAIGDETIFKNLLQNADSEKLRVLRRVVDNDDVMNKVRGTWLSNFIKENIEGDLSYRSIWNKFRDNKDMANHLFTPQEVNDFTDILKLGDRLGIPVMSTSGTGASNVLSELKSSIPEAIINDEVIKMMRRIAEGGEISKPPGIGAIGRPPIAGGRVTPRLGIQRGLQELSIQQRNNENAIDRRLNLR